MRHFLAVAVAALAIAAAAAPAQANQALLTDDGPATTQPRDTTIGGHDRLAYDVDLTTGRLTHAASIG